MYKSAFLIKLRVLLGNFVFRKIARMTENIKSYMKIHVTCNDKRKL